MGKNLDEFLQYGANDEIRNIFGQRLKALRRSKKVTQSELSAYLSKTLGDAEISRPATISNWEKQQKNVKAFPSLQKLEIIANYFGVSVEFLLGDTTGEINSYESRIASMSDKSIAHNNVKLLKVRFETLSCYDREPVFCVYDTGTGEWAIINADKGYLLFHDGHTVPFSDIDFDIYRAPLPFSYGLDGADMCTIKEIEKEEVKDFWVELIGGDFDARQKLKGWFKYDSKRKVAYNEAGYLLSISHYGKTWCAYKRLLEYDELLTPILTKE